MLVFAGLLLGGCHATAPAPPLPTLAAPANATALTASGSVAAGDAGSPPATWTPRADGPTAPPGSLATLAATGTPTVTPILPSRTPRPPTATPTPIDTATPLPTATALLPSTPIYPPTANLGPSKLGVHVITNNDPRIMDFVRAARPAVMKAVGDFGFLEEVKRLSPYTITIGRFEARSQDMVGNPEEEARKFVADQMQYYQANRFVDYWEGWNEPDPNLNRMSWYARFEAERVRVLAQYGFRAAIGGFPAGVPEMDEFMLFVPAIETALQYGGILTLHEGSAPVIYQGYGTDLPGFPFHADRGALSLRYRWYYREILEPAGLVIPLVVSELGVDGIIGNRPGPSGLGWRDFSDYWVRHGIGRTGVDAYLNQLAWYDAEVRQDGYVIGFAVFTAGGGDRWRTYDVNAILPDLAAYVRGQR